MVQISFQTAGKHVMWTRDCLNQTPQVCFSLLHYRFRLRFHTLKVQRTTRYYAVIAGPL